MPIIEVKGIESTLSRAQKTALIEQLTATLLSVMGEHLRPIVVVLLEEVKSGDWGIGGMPMTSEDVKSLADASE